MTGHDAGHRRTEGAGVLALIAVRFLLELALWSSFTVSGVRLIDGPVGWAAGLLATGLVMTAWAVLLSPRRPMRLRVGVRVAIELALFVMAAALLAAAGLPLAGAVLLVLEVLDLSLLRGPDRHAV